MVLRGVIEGLILRSTDEVLVDIVSMRNACKILRFGRVPQVLMLRDVVKFLTVTLNMDDVGSELILGKVLDVFILRCSAEISSF